MYRLIRRAVPAGGLKGIAMAYAATKLAGRLTRKNRFLRRGLGVANTAAWALPLGMMAWRRFGPRRPEPAAGD